MDFTDLGNRLVEAKALLDDPGLLDSYSHTFLLVLSRTSTFSHERLLAALEALEERGWALDGLTSHQNGAEQRMYALVRRKG